MFAICYALETLEGFENWNPSSMKNLCGMFQHCTSLEKITFGPYFDFDGIGNCPSGYKFSMVWPPM